MLAAPEMQIAVMVVVTLRCRHGFGDCSHNAGIVVVTTGMVVVTVGMVVVIAGCGCGGCRHDCGDCRLWLWCLQAWLWWLQTWLWWQQAWLWWLHNAGLQWRENVAEMQMTVMLALICVIKTSLGWYYWWNAASPFTGRTFAVAHVRYTCKIWLHFKRTITIHTNLKLQEHTVKNQIRMQNISYSIIFSYTILILVRNEIYKKTILSKEII